jgi:hypothetical protein
MSTGISRKRENINKDRRDVKANKILRTAFELNKISSFSVMDQSFNINGAENVDVFVKILDFEIIVLTFIES